MKCLSSVLSSILILISFPRFSFLFLEDSSGAEGVTDQFAAPEQLGWLSFPAPRRHSEPPPKNRLRVDSALVRRPVKYSND